jgi:murein DD-endopeptidase
MLFPFLPVLALAQAAIADAPAEVRPYQSLHLDVPYVPSVARVGGQDRLVYELHATNFSRRTLTIATLDVVDPATGAILARIDPAGAMQRIGPPGGNTRDLAFGQRAIFFISITWTDRGLTPVSHRISLDAARADAAPDRVAIAGGRIVPGAPAPAELGAPLRGGPWTAVYLPEVENGHRRFPYAVSGRVRLPGRHAIDWMPARGFEPRSAGTGVAPDGSGADVLAVADAEVVAVREAAAPGARPSVEDETGAMIVLRLPDGRFAHYQHLQPGLSLTVGARVRRGQVIARVGSSGHVTRPHLHFHVADGVAPLDSEGLPYRLGGARIVGRYASLEAFDQSQAWQPAAAHVADGLPAPFAVIRFDRE